MDTKTTPATPRLRRIRRALLGTGRAAMRRHTVAAMAPYDAAALALVPVRARRRR